MTANTGEIAMDEPSDMPEAHAEHSIESKLRFSDTSTVVIDYFPFGNPGAPIPGIAQRRSSTQQDSEWSPFHS